MSDTSNTDTNTQNDAATTGTGAQPSTGDAGAAQSQTAAPRTLENVYEDYETALADFNSKLDQSTAAKQAAIASAKAVVTLKQELDALEADVASTFDHVQAFLASA